MNRLVLLRAKRNNLLKDLNNSAFTLLEVLLAAIIFIISIAGIFATLSAVRTPVVSKEGSLSAAVFGKQVLEALRFQVSQQPTANFYACSTTANPCPDFALSVGQHQVSQATLTTYGLTWPQILIAGVNNNYPNGSPPVLSYTVTCADGSSSPCTNADVGRRVDLNINW